MSYTKNTWANGDVITAAKLNHMEDGIEGAGSGGGGANVVMFWCDDDAGTYHVDASYEDVKAMILAKTPFLPVYATYRDYSSEKYFEFPLIVQCIYDPYQDEITVVVTSSSGLIWTENSLTYVNW